ncbi:uncharacterized protein si:ch211-14k19.8 isoform X2 [Periophthalmus magnuspinnatus]|uniref:uncharacterized protein si:ch211-14k19.8 isoform X2 n=1 Tax=Periophthalmus magnuspinnatus TaxID=409849 RepID=UPI0024364ADE|nr:uncharacterized protein si:ch211-14k19.8 isoform X2 [Periophthalmus magnuspinnatus]
MVQLKDCLLLLLLLTDTSLVLLSEICNGHMDLSQKPMGHLTFNPKQGTDQTKRTLVVCTRTLEIPARHTVLLKLVWLERASNMSLLCVWGTKEWTLAVGDIALLSGCDQNKANLTWTGAGHSSNAFQLFYNGEEEKSSTETYTNPDSHPNIFTSSPDTTTDHSPFSESADLSGNSTRNSGLIQPTTTSPSISGSTGREASIFPGEEWNNGPDTSGATRRTDSPGTLDYFNTQHSVRSLDFMTSQNANLQTFSGSNEATTNSETSISTGFYTTSLPTSSIVPQSTELPQNKIHNLTENWQSVGTLAAKSLRTHYKELIKTSHSHFEYLARTSSSVEKKIAIGSTEMTHITTKSDAEFKDVTPSTQHVSHQETGLSTSMNFNPLHSTQESTESTEKTQTTSLGTSSTSLVPDLDIEKHTTSTSWTNSLNSTTHPEFGESGKDEAKTTERNDLFPTNSYSPQPLTTSTELKHMSTESMSTLSPGTLANQHSSTMHYNVRSATDLSTPPLNTIFVQQTFKNTAINDEILPKTVSSRYTTLRRDTASTILQETQNPHKLSVSTSNYQISYTSTLARKKEEKQKRASTTVVPQYMTSWTPEPVNRVAAFTQTYLSSAGIVSSTVQHIPKFFIVPDEPAIIRVESIELLLQIAVEESHPNLTEGLEEDTTLWLEPYLQRAPGFQELLGVWSSGAAVQCLLEFNTRGALQWLPQTGASSLLDRTGLRQAVRDGRSFRSARIANITLGGVQEVCGWLLQCPSGFTCVFDSLTSNFSCTSLCHSDYCQHHGLCTHHPGQPPLCRCVAGQDFWFMGPRCEVRMTRARLALSCLGVLLLLLALVAVVVGMVVRRYRALLIQAKVDQTRSSYRRFNHFDELSGHFWLRSRAGSADSLDNPAFTRSTEILHLRALERPCCYHDDSLSLPSTCPSPGTHIRTIYPHSSQYGWRGSDLSLADGVVDSGKASDLSVCSWPVEPIQWSPFPLLQQLSRQQAPVVRVSRPRSYCDGMELVEINKSWTA